jgi:superfamily II DNA or RNA helicase
MRYIYIRQHLAYALYNAVKLGLTTSIANRDATYATGEIIRGEFYPVFKIIKSDLSLKDIESKLKRKYDDLNIKGFSGGTEFFNIQIIDLIEEFFKEEHIGYKLLTKEEISKLLHVYAQPQPVEPQPVEHSKPQLVEPQLEVIHPQPEVIQPEVIQPEPEQPELEKPQPPSITQPEQPQPPHEWMARDYQIAAIEYGFNQLMTNSKFYLELPTGGGKSYITYNIMAACIQDLDLIIIQSPRKIVNSQNISDKYIQLINIQKENILNYSLDNNIDTFLKSNTELKIIIVCTQSIKLIYEYIKELKMLIWFDEAHYGIENWVKEGQQIDSEEARHGQINTKQINTMQINNFYLTNTENIKYRIFLSASPNRSFIIENSSIFGNLYSPTTVKQLIADKWLCPILPHIYKNNIENVNICTFTLNTFSSKGGKFGFSFHNLQEHAFELFYQHYIEYKENRTDIKPFLLVGDDFLSKLFSGKNDQNLTKAKRSEQMHRIKLIELDYDYLDIATFEEQFEEEYISFTEFSGEDNKLKRAKKRNIIPITESNRVGNHLAYVVAKFSMGYDFKLLNFIAFNDPKLSFKDIIQCIGRGIRPDCFGVYGCNLHKELILLIPMFYNKSSADATESDYGNIIEVIAYLINDVGLTYHEIIQIGTGAGGLKQIDTDAAYTGEEDNESILLDIMQYIGRSNKSMTYKQAKSILADKNIKSKQEYKDFYISYNLQFYKSSELLPTEPNMAFADFNWIDYLSIERGFNEGQYYTLEDCQKQIKKIMKVRPELKQYRYNLDQLVKLLCIDSIHQNFPPYEFWEDYYKMPLNIIILDNLFKSNKKIDI